MCKISNTRSLRACWAPTSRPPTIPRTPWPLTPRIHNACIIDLMQACMIHILILYCMYDACIFWPPGCMHDAWSLTLIHVHICMMHVSRTVSILDKAIVGVGFNFLMHTESVLRITDLGQFCFFMFLFLPIVFVFLFHLSNVHVLIMFAAVWRPSLACPLSPN